MNWNKWVRQVHRWLSMAFTVVVLTIFGALGLGEEPAEWVYFLPLLPLALLMLTGLYLFALPYAARWGARGARGWDSRGIQRVKAEHDPGAVFEP